MTAPLCFVDTETTSLRGDRQAWEIALIRRDAQGETEISVFVDVELDEADPFSLNVGRFWERHPHGRYLSGRIPDPFIELGEDGQFLRPRDAAELVSRFTHGAHLVGAVPNFDTEVFDRLLRAHGFSPAWHYHLIDVETLAVGYLWRKVAENLALGYTDSVLPPLPWKSDDLSRACGIEPPSEEERHTALGDARWALRWYDAIVGGGGAE